MPTISRADGSTINYSAWGEGRPVLFVASAGMSSQMWEYQRIHLVDHGFRAIAYDRRGHGRSDDPGGGYDYDTLAQDLALVMDTLDLHDAILVGHSMGGGEIIRYLTNHGADRVQKIVLLAATLPYPLRTADNPEGGADGAQAEALRQTWRQDYTRWVHELAPPFVGAGLPGCDVSDTLLAKGIADMLNTSLQAVIECNHAVLETDFRAELGKVTVPTLVVHGDSDASIPIEISGYRTAKLVPGAELSVYENAPHGLFITHRDRFNAELLDFASR